MVTPSSRFRRNCISHKELQTPSKPWLESLTYFLAGVMVFQQFDDVSLMAA